MGTSVESPAGSPPRRSGDRARGTGRPRRLAGGRSSAAIRDGRGDAFRALFEADPIGAALLDRHGRIVAANRALIRLAEAAGGRIAAILRQGGHATALFRA